MSNWAIRVGRLSGALLGWQKPNGSMFSIPESAISYVTFDCSANTFGFSVADLLWGGLWGGWLLAE
jgi:hypothetical protein